MITLRPAAQRGHADHGWLDTHHTFSFADYRDPAHMGFRSLRVMNEDNIAPTNGFAMHPHRDMEIVTYIISGQLEHRDSMGHQSTLNTGDVQAITAGTGIQHSETNPSDTDPVHLYQIWITPDRKGRTPAYDQQTLQPHTQPDRLHLFASNQAHNHTLKINQDAHLYVAHLTGQSIIEHTLQNNHHAWVQLIEGQVQLNGQDMTTGDGAAVSDEPTLHLQPSGSAHLLLIDLA